MLAVFAGGGTVLALTEQTKLHAELIALCGLGVAGVFVAAAFLLFRV